MTTNGLLNGRLDVSYNGIWGGVCDDGFGREEALVACRELGFASAHSFHTYTGTAAPDLRGVFWMDDVICNGRERFLNQCQHNGYGNHNCAASESIAITCDTSNPAPTTSSPPPPPSPYPQRLPAPPAPGSSSCTEECLYASDGDCDDGGPGGEFSSCFSGTDCTDCGIRDPLARSPQSPSPPPPVSQPSCLCGTNPTQYSAYNSNRACFGANDITNLEVMFALQPLVADAVSFYTSCSDYDNDGAFRANDLTNMKRYFALLLPVASHHSPGGMG